jgi:glycerol-1-phosphate dehydrogenase [NAD(P)+]
MAKNYWSILLVCDENTRAVCGDRADELLGEKVKARLTYEGTPLLVPDERAVERLYASITDDIDLIVGVGSGVINDLCKYCSHRRGLPYFIVATAPSMDGYASKGAAMIFDGMKITENSSVAAAIIADTEILANAPLEMIQAGYGDIVGKFSALCDWKLSTEINGEYFCQYIYDVTCEMIDNTKKTAEGLLVRDEESVKALMEALVVVGIMMSFAGSSRPASGSEHHLSHFFEIVGIVDNQPYFPHGIDVAYSTVITAKIREKILKSEFPNTLYRETREDYKKKMTDIYKSVAEGCIQLQDKVGNYAQNRLKTYKDKENEIKRILSDVPSAEEIEKILGIVGLDTAEFYSLYGIDKIQNAIAYAKDLKDRYTVLWLYYDLFGDCKMEFSE